VLGFIGLGKLEITGSCGGGSTPKPSQPPASRPQPAPPQHTYYRGNNQVGTLICNYATDLLLPDFNA
jgi:hypothetical protein